MPEGDSVHTHAQRIRENMQGRPLVRISGTEPSVRRQAERIRGSGISQVAAVGKHLLVDFDRGWTLRVHLGMTGHWRFGPRSSLRSDGPARVVLETAGWSARCFRAPTVQVGRTPAIWELIEHLGPDLLDDPPDIAGALTRARQGDQSRGISDLLLDQRIAAGIGNVYRNEVLFEAGVHPEHPVGNLSDERITWMFTRAADQMRRNVGRQSRTTTGTRRRGAETFVYGRAGHRCRRCGTQVHVGESTDLNRVTYWCPGCQPSA